MCRSVLPLSIGAKSIKIDQEKLELSYNQKSGTFFMAHGVFVCLSVRMITLK